MKSKFKMLAVLAAFAVTAPVLAACGETKSNAPTPGQSDQAPGSIINPSDGGAGNSSNGGGDCADTYVKRLTCKPPRTVVEGQKYNLDDYVTMTVEGCGHIDYQVNVETKGTARVNGHELTIIGVGNVSLEITADGKSTIFSSTAIAELQDKFDKATANVGNKYLFYQLSADSKTGEIEEEAWLLHNERYNLIYDYDISDGDYKPGAGDVLNGGGIIKLRNGDTYFYNLYNDYKDVVLVERSSADYSLYYMNMDLNLPYSAFTPDYDYETEDGELIDVLKATRTDGKYDFADNGSIFNQNLIDELSFKSGGDKYVPHTIYVYPWVNGEGKELWRMDMQLAKSTAPNVAVNQFAYWAFDFDADAVALPNVDTYIDTAALPEAVTFEEIPTAFDKYIAAKNYTLQVDCTISKLNDKANEITETDDQGYYLDSRMTSTVKVDNGKYYNSYFSNNDAGKMENGVFAAYEKDGKLMGFEQHGEDAATEPAQLKTSAGDGLTSLWNDTDLVPGELGTGSAVYAEDKFEVLSKKVNDGKTTISAAGDAIETFFKVFATQESVGQYLCAWTDYMTSQQGEDYYSVYDVVFECTADGIHVEISRPYVTLDNGTRTYAYIDYYYTAVGTTTIPELDSYLA